MTDVFDGLADIIIETFGEDVDYLPAGGPVTRISAIWQEVPLSVRMDDADVDGSKAELSVRSSDVPAPSEGDQVTRVKTGKQMVLTTPILPDGNGLIVCNMAVKA